MLKDVEDKEMKTEVDGQFDKHDLTEQKGATSGEKA